MGILFFSPESGNLSSGAGRRVRWGGEKALVFEGAEAEFAGAQLPTALAPGLLGPSEVAWGPSGAHLPEEASAGGAGRRCQLRVVCTSLAPWGTGPLPA